MMDDEQIDHQNVEEGYIYPFSLHDKFVFKIVVLKPEFRLYSLAPVFTITNTNHTSILYKHSMQVFLLCNTKQSTAIRVCHLCIYIYAHNKIVLLNVKDSTNF